MEDTLSRDFEETWKELKPLLEVKRNYESDLDSLRFKIADSFASRILRPYASMKQRLSGILERQKEIEELREPKLRETRISDSKREKLDKEYNKNREIIHEARDPLFDISSTLQGTDKVILGYVMAKNGLARFSCLGLRDFAYYKTPTTCWRCIRAYENAERLGILDYFESLGERRYVINPETTQTILFDAIPRIPNKKIVAEIQKERERLESQVPQQEAINELDKRMNSLRAYKNERREMIEEAKRNARLEIRDILRPITHTLDEI